MPAKDHNLIYLASPYSKYPGGTERAFEDVSALAGKLLLKGFKVYSPIALTHPIAVHGKIDPLDHSIWLPFDQAMMKVCEAILIAKMDTWEISFGISEEVKFFKAANKPVYYLDPASLKITQ
jgi:hypothetical protein